MILKKKKKLGQDKNKKKEEEEQSVANGIGLDRKIFGSCNMMYDVTCSYADA